MTASGTRSETCAASGAPFPYGRGSVTYGVVSSLYVVTNLNRRWHSALPSQPTAEAVGFVGSQVQSKQIFLQLPSEGIQEDQSDTV
jgi:hypothetical protein